MLEAKLDFLEQIERGPAAYVTLYGHAVPTAILIGWLLDRLNPSDTVSRRRTLGCPTTAPAGAGAGPNS